MPNVYNFFFYITLGFIMQFEKQNNNDDGALICTYIHISRI